MDTRKKHLDARAKAQRSQVALSAILRTGAGPHRSVKRVNRKTWRKEVWQ